MFEGGVPQFSTLIFERFFSISHCIKAWDVKKIVVGTVESVICDVYISAKFEQLHQANGKALAVKVIDKFELFAFYNVFNL